MINVIDIKNPRWANKDNTDSIELELTLQDGITIPFIASKNDCTVHGPELYNRAINKEFGEIKSWED